MIQVTDQCGDCGYTESDPVRFRAHRCTTPKCDCPCGPCDGCLPLSKFCVQCSCHGDAFARVFGYQTSDSVKDHE